MKWLKRTGLLLLALPFLCIVSFILYEMVGMYMNHRATERQTAGMQRNLEHEIPDIKILNVYSETGNISGTGNHVDCLSAITFSTEFQEDEIKHSLYEYYTFDQCSCYLEKLEGEGYLFYFITPAPFEDNIEGH